MKILGVILAVLKKFIKTRIDFYKIKIALKAKYVSPLEDLQLNSIYRWTKN